MGTALLVAAAWRVGLAPVWAAPTVVVAYVVGRSLSLGPAAAGGALLVLAYGAVG